MDTKQCPYCGEEVLAVAKKCKHCGEWLEKDTTLLENTQKNKLTEKVSLNNKPPNYGLLSQMALYAIIVEVLCIIKAFMGDGVHHLYGKARLLGLPDWVFTICSGFLMVYLLIGLWKHYMTKRADKPIPFLALICLTAGMFFFSFIRGIAADADVLILFLVLEWMVFIPVIVFEFIVGVQLTAKLKKASSVGIAMIVYAAAEIFGLFIVLFILASGFDYEVTPWVTFIDSGGAIYFFIVLKMFFNKEKTNDEIESTNDEDSKNTVIGFSTICHTPKMTDTPDETYYSLGYVKKPVNRNGEILIFLDVDDPAPYKNLSCFFVEMPSGLIPFSIEKIQFQNNGEAVVKLEGVRDETEAEALEGKALWLPTQGKRIKNLEEKPLALISKSVLSRRRHHFSHTYRKI